MLEGTVQTIPAGMRGIDTNTTLDKDTLQAFHAARYRYVGRYVRRNRKHTFDLTIPEAVAILHAGFGLYTIQHVDNENWEPTPELGTKYGAIAAAETQMLGFPAGVMVCCDLEGVKKGVPEEQVIAYLNAWYNPVRAALYNPILYVGWHPGVSARALYYRLKFQRYWAAYNLNKDQYPEVRGVCGQQQQEQTMGGVRFDPDVALVDQKGGQMSCLAPAGWPEV